MSSPETGTDTSTVAENGPVNTVAVIGLMLTLAAALMCGVLFATVGQLPEHKSTPSSPHSHSTSQPVPVDGEVPESQLAAALSDADTDSVPKANDGHAAATAQIVKAELAAQQLQVLLLASTMAVLNFLGLLLSIAGLFVPNHPRTVAIFSTVLSLLLFGGVFGVMAVGALLNPGITMISP